MKTFAAVLATVAVLALLWLGGEAHYQNCVAAAVATTSALTKEVEANPFNGFGEGSGGERFRAVQGCSRLP